MVVSKRKIPQERLAIFHSRYVKSRTCWNWIGRLTAKGYGDFDVSNTSLRAHRVAWMIFRGDIPRRLNVLHKCDNRKCVNPAHLFLGTQADNVRDMVRKGRDRPCRFEKNGRAILTWREVKSMRVMAAMGISNQRIGEEFNVSTNRAWAITTYRQWRD